jgi:hypothetical protein
MYLTKKNNVFNKPEPEKDDKGNIKRNCTTMFLLPSVLNSKVYTSEYGFINAYLQDHTHEVLYKDCLHVLFSPKKFTKDFEDYINALRQTDIYEEDYDISPEYVGKVMVVLRLNPIHNKVKELVLQGKFSEIDPAYMEKFITPVKDYKGDLTLPWAIYTKNKNLKEKLEERLTAKEKVTIDSKAELWSIPDLKNEIYNYNEKIRYE